MKFWIIIVTFALDTAIQLFLQRLLQDKAYDDVPSK